MKTGIRRMRNARAFRLAAALFLFCGFVALAPVSTSNAQQNILRIAAVVNEDIISILDLENRMRLIALSSNLNLTPEARQRLLPQVLRTMIDEKLQYQAAKEANVRVSEREVDQQIEQIAQQNNLPGGRMEEFLGSRGITITTLRNQVEAQIAWQKYAQRQLSRDIRIGPDQIDEELERIREAAQRPQKRVFEIFLGIENPDRANEVAQSAERLLNQIRNGANFPAIARSFSEGSTANQGGDLGWVSGGQLPSELDDALQALEPGEVSEPIRTLSGFHILQVTDERTADSSPADSTIDLVQLTAPVARNGGDADALSRRLANETGPLDGCEALQTYAAEQAGMTSATAEGIRIGNLPPPVRDAVLPLSAGEISSPISNRNAVVVLGICAREDAELNLPSRDEVQARLGNQRLELVIRRKMRDLRRAAFIDVRL